MCGKFLILLQFCTLKRNRSITQNYPKIFWSQQLTKPILYLVVKELPPACPPLSISSDISDPRPDTTELQAKRDGAPGPQRSHVTVVQSSAPKLRDPLLREVQVVAVLPCFRGQKTKSREDMQVTGKKNQIKKEQL